MILAVCFQLKQLKKQPEKKNSGLNGTGTHDLVNSQLTIYLICGLIAQWIEHYSGIARSWVRVPFKPKFFFQVAFSTA